jgi:methylated-DNA-protein-cysteine methyltransferase-like protein
VAKTIKYSEKNLNFFQEVYQVARLIPEGRVTSYGAIAKYLSVGRAARMVGWAMNGCPADVPAHRVVNRVGLLSGKNQFPAPMMMQALLEQEGITVKDDKVQDFKTRFWDPAVELEL